MGLSTVLLVSHHPADFEPIFRSLRNKLCCRVLVTDTTESLPELLRAQSVGLVVLNGPPLFCEPYLRFFRESRAKQELPPLIVVAAESSEAFAIAALRSSAVDYMTEPLNINVLTQSLSRWIAPISPACAEAPLTGGEALIGNSPVMQALRMQIRRVAATDCNVLITGDTGTGKELVAQLVHQNSARSQHPLVCINCAAIPDSLLESELFGYERGAFTGASAANQGKLMAANKGTAFFDEIGDMSPCAQAKILRAIETKQVQRLGATRTCETDIRVLAATHHNLDELAGTETFRRDLYFRLNVGRIHLPPLRERKADIPSLVAKIVRDLNQKMDRHVDGATQEAIGVLVQHEWPGNVRELKNVIERTFIACDSEKIAEMDLPDCVQRHSLRKQSTRNAELEKLRTALVTCRGNKSKAAEKLNWSRMTLYRKLAKYRLVEGS